MEWTPPDKDHFITKMIRRSKRCERKKGNPRFKDDYSVKLIYVVYDTVMTDKHKVEFNRMFDLLDIKDRRSALRYCQKCMDEKYELANNK